MSKIELLPSQTPVATYIDPMSDFGFKHLFGNEPNKDLLIDFLNKVLNGRKIITEITYNKNEHSGFGVTSRKMIFDLLCASENGEKFIIEVQRVRQEFFRDRAIYYSSRLIHEQAPQGNDWDYSLKEVYFIGLMDFVFDDSDRSEFLHYVRLSYEKSGKEFYNKLKYIFIEVPKFTKKESELNGGVDKWLYVLKNLSAMQKIPVILNTRIFSKLFQIAAVANLNKEEFMKYEKDQMASWDEYAIKRTLLKEGLEEGLKEGMEKGMEKGMKKGMEVKSYEFVKNMLITGEFTNSKIARLASVSEAFVRKVKKDINQD